jgi:serine/threonine protein phosphatase PrpC
LFDSKQLSPSTPHQLPLGLVFGISDTGTVRASNEDNFLIDRALGLVAVADGMGGHTSGEVASASALQALAQFIGARDCDRSAPVPDFTPSAFDPSQADPDATWTDATMRAMITLHDAVEFANARLYQANVAARRGDGDGMGTTITGVWQATQDGPLFVFHVGDSRLYRLRAGELAQLTRDQTLYQQALEAGEMHNLPGRNLLLQALGPSADIKPDLQIQAVSPGDTYLLCSDGLYGASSEQNIATLLGAASTANIGAICQQLIQMAKFDGSRDNITAVIIKC